MPGELLAVGGSLVGCVGLLVIVIALGASSTARYEFERNAVQAQQRSDAAAGTPGLGGPGGSGRSGRSGRGSGQPAAERPAGRAAVGLAAHPAGQRLAQGPATTGWWIVDEPGGQALAGPFADRIDADWAMWSDGLPGTARAVHGARRADGAVARRQTAQEQAWLEELGRQLDRLPGDWAPFMTDEDVLTSLAVEITAALVEAGLPLHDGQDAVPGAAPGGVCLVPHPAGLGVLVSWRQHDRMSVSQIRGAAMEAAVQRTMSTAVATVLEQMGFPIEQFGDTGAHLVTAAPR